MPQKRVDWSRIDEIKQDYLAGMSCQKLAVKYGIPRSTLQSKSVSEGWPQMREEIKRVSSEKIAEELTARALNTALTVADVATELLNVVRDGVCMRTMVSTANDVRAVAGALRDIAELRGDMTDLQRDKITAQIEQLRAQTKSVEREIDQGGKTVRLEIADGLAEFSE